MDYFLYLCGVGLVIVIIWAVETWMGRRRNAAPADSAGPTSATTGCTLIDQDRPVSGKATPDQ